MRVLQVFNEYRQRGGEAIWVDTLSSLVGDAIELYDLRFRSDDWMGPKAPSKFRQMCWLGDNPSSRQRLREAVRLYQPEVLLYHNLIPVASLGLYDEARRLGLPVVQYIHNFRPFSASGYLWVNGQVNDAALRGNPWPEILTGAWNGSRLKTAVLAWHLARLRRSGALDAVKLWLAISEFMRDQFIAAGIPSERIVTLRHCWEAGPPPSNVEEADYYLFLGRLCPEKGVHTLLETWQVLEHQLGPKCPRLVIAGQGPMENDVIQAAGKSNCIEYAGFVDGERKHKLLARCRALVAPSIWWEPLGLIVYEAYAAARPVLAARSGGLSETVTGGVTGFLHEPGNSEQLARDVERMENLKENGRGQMGCDGRRWLLQHASSNAWRERLIAIVRRVARGQHAAPEVA